MAPKKDKDTVALKGKDAEEAILCYMKKMNRPYSSTDVSSNLKNAVTKLAAQKILSQLAEEGRMTQKVFGKTTLFVTKQEELETLSPERQKEMTEDTDKLKVEQKELAEQVKLLEKQLTALNAEPTDDMLDKQVIQAESELKKLREEIEPLKKMGPKATREEMEAIDGEWNKWRHEWKSRKKVFQELFSAVTDALGKDDKEKLEDDLGIENDSAEHIALEKTPLWIASVNQPNPVKPVKPAKVTKR